MQLGTNVVPEATRLLLTTKMFQVILVNVCTVYGKMSAGKSFKTFVVFHSTKNIFLRVMALSISSISLQKCYYKSFTANNYFPFKIFHSNSYFPFKVVKSASSVSLYRHCVKSVTNGHFVSCHLFIYVPS